MHESQMLLSLISHEVDGLSIPQRVTDGYINATALCQASGKQFGHYLANKNTKAFLEELSSDIGIPISELVIVTKGGNARTQGTWMHPDIAVNLGQWLSPKFAVLVSKWVREWMSGKFAPIRRKTNKSVESNGRGGVCRSFHVVRELREVAERRCPPVPHLLRSIYWISPESRVDPCQSPFPR